MERLRTCVEVQEEESSRARKRARRMESFPHWYLVIAMFSWVTAVLKLVDRVVVI